MPTSFIAVQCFECSTMQVKQQKKSSNRWTCVVCNQKQSVRKVFAQSFMAKDVRKFVQNFNMSRQLSDQEQFISKTERDAAVSPKIEEQKRKRNDWTEYIDDEPEEDSGRKFENESSCAQGDGVVEPVIVTEMPQATFAKPKVKDYSFSRFSSEKLLKPSFPNRRNGKMHQNTHSLDLPCSERAEDSGSQALKWNSFIAQIRNNCKPPQVINNESHSNAVQKVSKWSPFITDDDDSFADHSFADYSLESRERRDDHLLKLSMNAEIVEEDIHPDFL